MPSPVALFSNPDFAWLSGAAVQYAMIAVVFVLAGVVKGVVGLGLPTVAMSLLALMMPSAQAAALLVVPSLVTNIWQIRPWRGAAPVLRRVAPMQIGICVGTGVGAIVFGAPAGAWTVVLLGAVLVLYAIWGLFGKPVQISSATQRWMGPAVGTVTGAITSVTGVFVVPAVPYMQSLGMTRDELIQAMGVAFTVSTLALGVALAANGIYSASVAGTSAFMLVPALAGMSVGQRLRQTLSPGVFRMCFFGSLAILGIYMICGALNIDNAWST